MYAHISNEHCANVYSVETSANPTGNKLNWREGKNRTTMDNKGKREQKRSVVTLASGRKR